MLPMSLGQTPYLSTLNLKVCYLYDLSSYAKTHVSIFMVGPGLIFPFILLIEKYLLPFGNGWGFILGDCTLTLLSTYICYDLDCSPLYRYIWYILFSDPFFLPLFPYIPVHLWLCSVVLGGIPV